MFQINGSGSRGPIPSQPCPSPSNSLAAPSRCFNSPLPLAGADLPSPDYPTPLPGCLAASPRRMSRSSWETGVRTLHSPRCGARGDEYPRSLLMAGDGSFRPSGFAAVPVRMGGRMLPARGTGSSRERGLRGDRVPHGQCPAKDGKGSPVAAGRERMRVLRGPPLRAGQGERGLSRERGSGALTFLHAWAQRPPRLALPVFEQSLPDWIWGKKGARVGWREGWSQAGPRPPQRPPAGSVPAAPGRSPLPAPPLRQSQETRPGKRKSDFRPSRGSF